MTPTTNPAMSASTTVAAGAMFCDQCGQPTTAADRTCPSCGAHLAPAVTDPTMVRLAGASVAARLRGRYPRAGQLPHGPPARTYLTALVARNLRGTLAGIFGGWFQLPFVILMAGAGAVVGALAGAVSGTVAGVGVLARIDALLTFVFPLPVKAADLLPTAGAQIGGIIGALLGAGHGGLLLGWLALAWPWQALYAGDPMWPVAVAVGQTVTAVAVGFGYVAGTSACELLVLRIGGARRLSRRETAFLMPIVDEAAVRLRLHTLPRVLINDRRELNAHAGIRHIVINQGLLEQLNYDRDQIGAVVAHELAHWQVGDPIARAWSKGVALPLYLLHELAHRLLHATRIRPLQFLVRLLFWSVIVTTRYVVIPAQAAVWRDAEYRADAAAANAGYRDGLRAALSHIRATFDGERSGWDAALLATHPATELRLERLEQHGRAYPMREDHPLIRALPGWHSQHTVAKDRPVQTQPDAHAGAAGPAGRGPR